ncbi:hypothetical protein AB0O34_26645 [Sphaerisporangium sp. NPDC088356]|uniref:hypothetical protein n=1 Tax=Sphaerisporangium sp. NPDC088356 TaxID=3154871 RepID=UPI003438C2BE
MAINVGRLTLAVLVLVISGITTSVQASAGTVAIRQGSRAAGSDDRGAIVVRIGNGVRNRAYLQLKSPTYLSGAQSMSNSTISGRSRIQAVICKKGQRRCSVVQMNKGGR